MKIKWIILVSLCLGSLGAATTGKAPGMRAIKNLSMLAGCLQPESKQQLSVSLQKFFAYKQFPTIRKVITAKIAPGLLKLQRFNPPGPVGQKLKPLQKIFGKQQIQNKLLKPLDFLIAVQKGKKQVSFVNFERALRVFVGNVDEYMTAISQYEDSTSASKNPQLQSLVKSTFKIILSLNMFANKLRSEMDGILGLLDKGVPPNCSADNYLQAIGMNGQGGNIMAGSNMSGQRHGQTSGQRGRMGMQASHTHSRGNHNLHGNRGRQKSGNTDFADDDSFGGGFSEPTAFDSQDNGQGNPDAFNSSETDDFGESQANSTQCSTECLNKGAKMSHKPMNRNQGRGMRNGTSHGGKPHGMRSGMNHGMQPGMRGMGMNHGMRTGMGHGMGMNRGMHPGMNRGMRPGMNQTMHQPMNPGQTPFMGRNMRREATGMNPGMAQGMRQPLNPGQKPFMGRNMRLNHGVAPQAMMPQNPGLCPSTNMGAGNQFGGNQWQSGMRTGTNTGQYQGISGNRQFNPSPTMDGYRGGTQDSSGDSDQGSPDDLNQGDQSYQQDEHAYDGQGPSNTYPNQPGAWSDQYRGYGGALPTQCLGGPQGGMQAGGSGSYGYGNNPTVQSWNSGYPGFNPSRPGQASSLGGLPNAAPGQNSSRNGSGGTQSPVTLPDSGNTEPINTELAKENAAKLAVQSAQANEQLRKQAAAAAEEASRKAEETGRKAQEQLADVAQKQKEAREAEERARISAAGIPREAIDENGEVRLKYSTGTSAQTTGGSNSGKGVEIIVYGDPATVRRVSSLTPEQASIISGTSSTNSVTVTSAATTQGNTQAGTSPVSTVTDSAQQTVTAANQALSDTATSAQQAAVQKKEAAQRAITDQGNRLADGAQQLTGNAAKKTASTFGRLTNFFKSPFGKKKDVPKT